ncbi:MAG TPA: phenylalanine 4-monooxygenase [Steroidobacteraceae bacterium]|nr:phenylalanine 4-monooxygenase [Steroidobacteraceae bacterium]
MAQLPVAPTQSAVKLRGDYAHAGPDFRLAQNYDAYTPDEHAIWRTLFERQSGMLQEHAAPEFTAGLRLLGVDSHHIPRLDEASERLQRLTGFEVIGVPGLIPEQDFFAHLAERRFPVTTWMRRRDELDYLVEPDLFHDFFGHLPMLAHTVFANFIQAYGAIGAHAREPAALKMLARLYWYTVEFGLVATGRGLRAYGAGILSSSGETIYATRATGPARIGFDLRRVLRTNYLIDAYQKTYFVLDDIEQLFDSVLAADFDALFAEAHLPGHAPDARLPEDQPVASLAAS